jgi:hypothetical protein
MVWIIDSWMVLHIASHWVTADIVAFVAAAETRNRERERERDIWKLKRAKNTKREQSEKKQWKKGREREREIEGWQRKSHDNVYDGARADSGGAVMLEPFSNAKFYLFLFLKKKNGKSYLKIGYESETVNIIEVTYVDRFLILGWCSMFNGSCCVCF